MNEVDLRCLLGEYGDILLRDDIYQQGFTSIPSEPDGGYRRLVDLPRSKDVILIDIDVLLLVTEDGELIIIDNDHPEGIILDTEIPSIKKIYNSIPLGILDDKNTLHFVNWKEAIERSGINSLVFDDHPVTNPPLEDVKWIIPYHNNYGDVIVMYVSVPKGLIATGPEVIASGTYLINRRYDYQLIGNSHSYYSKGIRYAEFRGGKKVEIADDVIDVIQLYAIRRDILTYTLNSRDELSLMDRGITIYTKKPEFSPTRLIASINNDHVYVEDSEGNLYDANLVVTNDTPVESLNLPVILHGFKRQGRRVKPVAKYPSVI